MANRDLFSLQPARKLPISASKSPPPRPFAAMCTLPARAVSCVCMANIALPVTQSIAFLFNVKAVRSKLPRLQGPLCEQTRCQFFVPNAPKFSHPHHRLVENINVQKYDFDFFNGLSVDNLYVNASANSVATCLSRIADG